MNKKKTNLLYAFLPAFFLPFLSWLPLITNKISGIYFTIDPEVMYTANSYLYLKSGNIDYFDQPGVPAIVMMAGYLFPLNIYTKLIENISFVTFSLNNLDFIFLYLRIFQFVLLLISLGLLFFTIIKITKSRFPVLLLCLFFLLFTPFYYLGISISAEATTFLIVSLWLTALIEFVTNKSIKGLFFVNLLAGLAFASRATAFFLIPATLILSLFNIKKSIGFNLSKLTVCVLLILYGFLIGIFPVIYKIKYLIGGIFNFAASTEIHGGGQRILFDFKSYLNSIQILYNSHFETLIVVSINFLVFLYGMTLKNWELRKLSTIGLLFICGTAVFAKFPLAHYQTFNYLVIIFLGTYILYKSTKMLSYFLLFTILFVPGKIKDYSVATNNLISESVAITQYTDSYFENTVNIWQWAKSRQFVKLWLRDYAPAVFDDKLKKLDIPFYEMVGEYKIKFNASEIKDLEEVCWDYIFVQDSQLDGLLLKYPDLAIETPEKIEGTNHYLVGGGKCIKKP